MATRLTATLVGQLVERIWDDGSADLTKELAVPLPVTLIAEILGVPSLTMADSRRWSDALLATLAAESEAAWGGRDLAALAAVFFTVVEPPGQATEEALRRANQDT